jgi:hypothetical protein
LYCVAGQEYQQCIPVDTEEEVTCISGDLVVIRYLINYGYAVIIIEVRYDSARGA